MGVAGARPRLRRPDRAAGRDAPPGPPCLHQGHALHLRGRARPALRQPAALARSAARSTAAPVAGGALGGGIILLGGLPPSGIFVTEFAIIVGGFARGWGSRPGSRRCCSRSCFVALAVHGSRIIWGHSGPVERSGMVDWDMAARLAAPLLVGGGARAVDAGLAGGCARGGPNSPGGDRCLSTRRGGATLGGPGHDGGRGRARGAGARLSRSRDRGRRALALLVGRARSSAPRWRHCWSSTARHVMLLAFDLRRARPGAPASQSRKSWPSRTARSSGRASMLPADDAGLPVAHAARAGGSVGRARGPRPFGIVARRPPGPAAARASTTAAGRSRPPAPQDPVRGARRRPRPPAVRAVRRPRRRACTSCPSARSTPASSSPATSASRPWASPCCTWTRGSSTRTAASSGWSRAARSTTRSSSSNGPAASAP